jgi:thiol-disulfide isomerase/thioredoxin
MRSGYFKFSIVSILTGVILTSGVCLSKNNKIVLINLDQNWDKAHFSYYKSTSNVPITYSDMLKWHMIDKNSYILEIETDEPLLFNFSRNWENLMVYAFPGDTVSFKTSYVVPYELNGNRSHDELMFFSFLNAFGLGFSNHNNIRLEVTSIKELDGFSKQAWDRYIKRIRFLESFEKMIKLSVKGKSTLKNAIFYKYVSEMFTPYFSTALEDKSAIPIAYKAKLKSFANELKKDTLLYLMEYRSFVFDYACFSFAHEGSQSNDLASKSSFYIRNFSGKLRDFLLNNEIKGNFIRNIPMSFDEIKAATDSIQSKVLKDSILSIYERMKKKLSLAVLQTPIETQNGDKITLEDLLSLQSQKTLYLDFWATWCGPCLLEMPNSQKLANEFIPREVEFIYLSVDTDKDKWNKKLATLPKGKNVHHYLISPESDLAKEFEIPPIPRYMLIGKDGRLISNDAPRPQSKEARELILESLIKK